jgi:type II secretory pathway predicted ATPase ExeA
MATSTRFPSTPITDRPAMLDAFGLTADPFPADPTRGGFVATSIHEPARESLRRWANDMIQAPNHVHRLGVVTGEDGTGKTRLLAELERSLAGNDRLHVVTLPDVPAHRTDAQLLKAILVAFGADPAGRTGLELRGEVRDALRALQRSSTQPGILIDDADFKGSQLELVRNLLRDAEGTGLWIVLFGTPDLHDRTRRRRSLRGLLGPEISLDALPDTDIERLLQERVDTVRTAATPDALIAPEAIEALTSWSGGNAAQLLRAARAALETAANQGRGSVTSDIARHAIRTLTIDDANDARAEVAAAAAQPVQTQMPLLESATRGSSSATTQQALWNEEGSA